MGCPGGDTCPAGGGLEDQGSQNTMTAWADKVNTQSAQASADQRQKELAEQQKRTMAQQQQQGQPPQQQQGAPPQPFGQFGQQPPMQRPMGGPPPGQY